jgi:hypothetical protein
MKKNLAGTWKKKKKKKAGANEWQQVCIRSNPEKTGRSCEGADFSWLSSKVSRTLLPKAHGWFSGYSSLCCGESPFLIWQESLVALLKLIHESLEAQISLQRMMNCWTSRLIIISLKVIYLTSGSFEGNLRCESDECGRMCPSYINKTMGYEFVTTTTQQSKVGR